MEFLTTDGITINTFEKSPEESAKTFALATALSLFLSEKGKEFGLENRLIVEALIDVVAAVVSTSLQPEHDETVVPILSTMIGQLLRLARSLEKDRKEKENEGV